ncbi:MAG: MATE family efflux transporter [Bacteroidota bacterium]
MKKLWTYFWIAVRGEEKDFTSGSLERALFLLSVPIVLEMSMEALFAIFDAFFVSLLGNEEYLATIGLTETSLFVVVSLALGIAMAATAMVSRRIGEKKPEEASDAAFQAILMAILFAVVIGVLGFFYAEDLLRILGGSEELVEQGSGYTRIMLMFNVVLMLLFTINAIFRGAGDAAIAMRTLILANGLNLILDPCLIFGLGPCPKLGFEGAAIATCIGRGVGVLYQCYHLFNGRHLIKLSSSNFRIIPTVIRRLLHLTGGAAGQHLLTSFSWLLMVTIVATFGSKVLAAYTISFRIIAFTILPSWGVAMAAATLVGQNLGAGDPHRAEQTVWKASWYNMILLGIISILFMVFARQAIGVFSDDPIVLRDGTLALRIIFAGYIFYAYEMVIGQAFNGAGDTYTPTLLNFIAFWVVQIPLAWFLARHTGLESTGIYVSIAVSSTILAAMAIYVFRQGKWKTKEV